MKKLLYGLLLAVFMPWFSVGCEKEDFADEGDVRLTFSADTLTFDTVFTTLGSTTLRLTARNDSRDNLRLSTVTLAGGRNSRFRLNVDGDTSLVARDVEVLAGDSIFIFVQVNINPNDSTSPFLVEDAIVFSNGQRLPLTAYGRNAVYHVTPADSTWLRIGTETWNATLPHIVVGNVLVTENQTLTIDPGAEVYFANDACLILDSTARLVARGTAAAPILFTSLRHDGWYRFLPGQWGLIWFYNYSVGNVVEHAVIENGIGGLRCYPQSQVTVKNTVIRNMSDCAIVGQGATVTGNNLLVYDCLTSFIALMGGNYDFRHCTFADYWSYSARKMESVVLSNCMNTVVNNQVVTVGGDLLKADFTDCIIWGTYQKEVLLSELEGYAMNHNLAQNQSCIVKGGARSEDPLFTDPRNDDYTLQEGSPATGLGYQWQ